MVEPDPSEILGVPTSTTYAMHEDRALGSLSDAVIVAEPIRTP